MAEGTENFQGSDAFQESAYHKTLLDAEQEEAYGVSMDRIFEVIFNPDLPVMHSPFIGIPVSPHFADYIRQNADTNTTLTDMIQKWNYYYTPLRMWRFESGQLCREKNPSESNRKWFSLRWGSNAVCQVYFLPGQATEEFAYQEESHHSISAIYGGMYIEDNSGQMNWYPAGYMANFTPQDVELAPVDFKREMETYREEQAKGPLMQRVRKIDRFNPPPKSMQDILQNLILNKPTVLAPCMQETGEEWKISVHLPRGGLYLPVDVLPYSGLQPFTWYELPPGRLRPNYDHPRTKRYRDKDDETHFVNFVNFEGDSNYNEGRDIMFAYYLRRFLFQEDETHWNQTELPPGYIVFQWRHIYHSKVTTLGFIDDENGPWKRFDKNGVYIAENKRV